MQSISTRDSLALVKSRKTAAMVTVLRDLRDIPINDILVVGCGDGTEAGDLARAFAARTIGIDPESHFDPEASKPATLMKMDARELEFADASFDLVYSFHALEHIPQPRQALAEMARVLRPGGSYMIGTPNRHRLLGYMGAPDTLANKVRWNLSDLKMRLTGRWSNEQGAHAGFSERELIDMCRDAFTGEPRSKSHLYYRTLYASRAKSVDALSASALSALLYPCVYVGGWR